MTKFAKWTTVRGFGEVKYFNISYAVLLLVPLVFDLFQKTDVARQAIGVNFPFPETLRWLYGASICYAISITLYQLFCPLEIKRFVGSDDYAKAQFELFSRAHPERRVSIVLSNLDPQRDADIISKITSDLKKIEECNDANRPKLQKSLDEFISAHFGHAIQRFLISHFDRLNEVAPCKRMVSLFFYVVGTLILIGLLIMRSVEILILK